MCSCQRIHNNHHTNNGTGQPVSSVDFSLAATPAPAPVTGEKKNVGLIVGVSVGVGVAVSLISIVSGWLWCRWKQQKGAKCGGVTITSMVRLRKGVCLVVRNYVWVVGMEGAGVGCVCRCNSVVFFCIIHPYFHNPTTHTQATQPPAKHHHTGGQAKDAAFYTINSTS